MRCNFGSFVSHFVLVLITRVAYKHSLGFNLILATIARSRTAMPTAISPIASFCASKCAFLCTAASNNKRILGDGAQTITRKSRLYYGIRASLMAVFETKVMIPTATKDLDYSALLCDRKSLQRESADGTTRFIKTIFSDTSNKRAVRAVLQTVSFTP